MKKYLLLLCLSFCGNAFAHPMPSSIVSLSVLETFIRGEAKIPLLELANAVGEERAKNLADAFFETYFVEHIQAFSNRGQWKTIIESIDLVTGKDPLVGTYQEVVVRFTLTPLDVRDLRSFAFDYDVVMHQVVTHSALVYVQQDWRNGINEEASTQQIGAIKLDVPTEKIYPLQINLAEGSRWKGFTSMINLGIRHIAEGTDHLMFLLVLLLPAPLVVIGRRWGGFGGVRYSIFRLLKIVTAFTIGHSVTLLLGSLGWVRLPSQPVEILIAFSILLSAIHALRPLFPGRETLVGASFGLVHGLAFASTLANLNLDAGPMALSILGFNLGIEAMQLFVIAITVPWLVLLSKQPVYKWVRIVGALLAAVAAVAWMLQRYLQKDNPLSTVIDEVAVQGKWLVFGLAVLAITVYFLPNQKTARAVSKKAGMRKLE